MMILVPGVLHYFVTLCSEQSLPEMSTCLCCFAHAQTNSPRSRGTLRNVARANNQWAWECRYQAPVIMKRKSLFLELDKLRGRI
ncbi:hypothetical protein HNQ77_001758 [Silvibacterium bohemicum]|uniref:Uncharacterized protein n=1 Tax=Silvibacterium bohemicum TaxID=1577686 RepID=A0A841JVN9_9BACT|nr:hypothetical protein [Silvibacterium bohemicum]